MNIEPINVERILLNSSLALTVLFAIAEILAVVLVSKTLGVMAVGVGIALYLALVGAFVASLAVRS